MRKFKIHSSGTIYFFYQREMESYSGPVYQDCSLCDTELQIITGRADSDEHYVTSIQGQYVPPVVCGACHEKFRKVVELLEEFGGDKEFIRNSLGLM